MDEKGEGGAGGEEKGEKFIRVGGQRLTYAEFSSLLRLVSKTDEVRTDATTINALSGAMRDALSRDETCEAHQGEDEQREQVPDETSRVSWCNVM